MMHGIPRSRARRLVPRWFSVLPLTLLFALAACESPLASPGVEAADGIADLAYVGDLSNILTSWSQGFEADTDDWTGTTRVASGTGGIPSVEGSFHGEASGGSFSRFGSYSSIWPGDYLTELAIHLDPAWSAGAGFDFSVASNGADGAHQRDFIFHVGVVPDGRLLVNGDNNTYGGVNSFILENGGDGTPYEVSVAGWYTFQHVFYDDGGVLAVDMNLLDPDGNVVFTITRSDPADTIPDEVGGNRYAWLIFSTAPTLAIDGHRMGTILSAPGSKDDCKNGGWQAYGFRNQGQCIASVQANPSAGK